MSHVCEGTHEVKCQKRWDMSGIWNIEGKRRGPRYSQAAPLSFLVTRPAYFAIIGAGFAGGDKGLCQAYHAITQANTAAAALKTATQNVGPVVQSGFLS